VTDATLRQETGDARHRPIGVVVLSCVAFLSSACVFAVAVLNISQVIRFLRHAPQSVAEYVMPPAYFVVPIAWICLNTLAWLAFRAGIDLWHMRSRGRKLTIISMILLVPLGILFVTSPSAPAYEDRLIGLGICLICAASLSYLFLPRVRMLFIEEVAQPCD
jgi:hypothetical protein